MIGILVCGPSGVGKSSNLSKIFNDIGIHELELIDPDNRQEKTQEERSSKSREELLSKIEKEEDFVYSGSCLRGQFIESVLEKMHKKGYRIIMAIIYSSVDTSLKRISLRKEQHVPSSIIKTFHRLFYSKAEKYMNNSLINEILLYNNEEKFTLILDKKNKKISCHSKESFYFDISPYCSSI